MKRLPLQIHALLFIVVAGFPAVAEDNARDYSPRASERQLPLAMHSMMVERPRIRVGVDSGDLMGRDNRVLQAAVDYMAALGGGTVEIGPGEFLMSDSLHLRSHVHIEGAGKSTVLRKSPSAVAALGLDGDFGEQQITIEDGTRFEVGQGVAVWDDQAGGFHTTVATITGKTDNTYSINRPLMADCMVRNHARAATVFPVVSGYDCVGVELRGLTIDGNKQSNVHLNGCRGAGIFLYRAFGTLIEDCTVRDYDGDGISFQQSNDVTLRNCVSQGNTQLGLHPGSGSQRPRIYNCLATNNGTDGLFLCWRVRHGVFENNTLEQNGRYGISIGHKDTDNLLKKNVIRLNHSNGIFFRDEALGMAAHRNQVIENTIENNGQKPGTAAIRVRGETRDLVLKDNLIRDTRDAAQQTQTIGVLLEPEVGPIEITENRIEAHSELEDRRDR